MPPVQVDRDADAQLLTVRGVDRTAGLEVTCELRMEPSGLLRVRHTVTNAGDGPYALDALLAVLPVPDRAGELLDLTGRWCRDHTPQRQHFTHGTHARESRRGRTGHDATLLLVAGTPGFGFRSGEVWAVHTGWSGNHVHLAERLPEGAGAGGAGVLGGGELLLPGEVRLAPGESYTTPWIFFTYASDGLDGPRRACTGGCAPARSTPAPRGPVLNTWEAVYFDQDLDTLTRLAERAARVGAERFVLDDGWFGARRDDTRGLGDWYVAPEVWPQGLRPLADRVRDLGMDFGSVVRAGDGEPRLGRRPRAPGLGADPSARGWRG